MGAWVFVYSAPDTITAMDLAQLLSLLATALALTAVAVSLLGLRGRRSRPDPEPTPTPDPAPIPVVFDPYTGVAYGEGVRAFVIEDDVDEGQGAWEVPVHPPDRAPAWPDPIP